MSQWRKKPILIEAFCLSGKPDQEYPPWAVAAVKSGVITYGYDGLMHINTLEGIMRVSIGDWIIKGVEGELYPVKQRIFEATYEAVDEPLPKVRWHKAEPEQVFEDGDELIVTGQITGQKRWCEIITIACDENYFEFTDYSGESIDLQWCDVTHWCRTKDILPDN